MSGFHLIFLRNFVEILNINAIYNQTENKRDNRTPIHRENISDMFEAKYSAFVMLLNVNDHLDTCSRMLFACQRWQPSWILLLCCQISLKRLLSLLAKLLCYFLMRQVI